MTRTRKNGRKMNAKEINTKLRELADEVPVFNRYELVSSAGSSRGNVKRYILKFVENTNVYRWVGVGFVAYGLTRSDAEARYGILVAKFDQEKVDCDTLNLLYPLLNIVDYRPVESVPEDYYAL